MTDPWFLETMTLSTLLPIEQPMIVAHEWAHLAGYADEGEANFVGWLTCLGGDAAARYSAWLFLYMESASAVDAAARRDVAPVARRRPARRPGRDRRAGAGPGESACAAVGWRIYDQYLKANGVEQGTRSYTDVVRLVLGTTLGTETLTSISGAPPDPTVAPPPARRTP